MDKGVKVAESTGSFGKESILTIPNPISWSLENPHLYDFEISLLKGKKVIDKVTSYGALRKVSIVYDSKGMQRFALNDEQVFHYGPLDQGWWPDGLYTAPTDEALAFGGGDTGPSGGRVRAGAADRGQGLRPRRAAAGSGPSTSSAARGRRLPRSCAAATSRKRR